MHDSKYVEFSPNAIPCASRQNGVLFCELPKSLSPLGKCCLQHRCSGHIRIRPSLYHSHHGDSMESQFLFVLFCLFLLLLLWLYCIAYGILGPPPRIEPGPPAAQSPNYWTIRQFRNQLLINSCFHSCGQALTFC